MSAFPSRGERSFFYVRVDGRAKAIVGDGDNLPDADPTIIRRSCICVVTVITSAPAPILPDDLAKHIIDGFISGSVTSCVFAFEHSRALDHRAHLIGIVTGF